MCLICFICVFIPRNRILICGGGHIDKQQCSKICGGRFFRQRWTHHRRPSTCWCMKGIFFVFITFHFNMQCIFFLKIGSKWSDHLHLNVMLITISVCVFLCSGFVLFYYTFHLFSFFLFFECNGIAPEQLQ